MFKYYLKLKVIFPKIIKNMSSILPSLPILLTEEEENPTLYSTPILPGCEECNVDIKKAEKKKKRKNKNEYDIDIDFDEINPIDNIDDMTKEYIQDKRTDFLYDNLIHDAYGESFITNDDVVNFIKLLKTINVEHVSEIQKIKKDFYNQIGFNKAILFNSLVIFEIDLEALLINHMNNNNNYMQTITKNDLTEHIIIELYQAIQTCDPLMFTKILYYMNEQDEDEPILKDLYVALVDHYKNRTPPSIFSDFMQMKNYYKSMVIKNIKNCDNYSIDAILTPNCGRKLFIQLENYKITDYWLKKVGDNKINSTIIEEIQEIFYRNKHQFTKNTYIFEILYNKIKEVNILIVDCCVLDNQQLVNYTYSERYDIIHKNLEESGDQNLYILVGKFVNLQIITQDTKKFIENNVNSLFDIFINKRNYLIKVDQPLYNNIKYVELDMSNHYKFLIIGSCEIKNKLKYIVATKSIQNEEKLTITGLANISKQSDANINHINTSEQPINNWNFDDEIRYDQHGLFIHNELVSQNNALINYYSDYIIIDVNNYTKTAKSKIAKITISALNVYKSNEYPPSEILDMLTTIDLNENKKKSKKILNNSTDIKIKKTIKKKKEIKIDFNKIKQCELILSTLNQDEVVEIKKFLKKHKLNTLQSANEMDIITTNTMDIDLDQSIDEEHDDDNDENDDDDDDQ